MVDGLLLIDKPAGISSFDVVRQVRRAARTRKVGHTGTLDPLATGLLPIVVGRCTKLARFLSLDTKEYDFRMRLGQETTSGDAEGEVSRECAWDHVTKEALEGVLERFRGDIEQVPPIYSAIKIDGKRAYELARAGEEVEIPPRPVHIERLVLKSCALPDARLLTRCSSGTYVRSLARDIGVELRSCAFTTSIRRTQVGDFSLDEATPLADISEENIADILLSPAQMMRAMPRFIGSEADCRALGYGQRIDADLGELALGAHVAVLNQLSELVAVCKVEATEPTSRLKPVRVLITQ